MEKSNKLVGAMKRNNPARRQQPTRRDALVTITAGAATAGGIIAGIGALAQAPAYRPAVFSSGDFKLLTALVELIIPTTDTPGAAAAGADRYIDEEAVANPEARNALQAGFSLLREAGFESMDEAGRTKLLTDWSAAGGAKGAFFKTLKDMTIDGYYSSEIGLLRELGYKGNTFLAEFPGCQHPEHA
jgi:hypothetical protein